MLELVLISTAALAIMLLLPEQEIRRPEEGRREARALLRNRQRGRRRLGDVVARKAAGLRQRTPAVVRSRHAAVGLGGALLVAGALAGAGLAGDGEAAPERSVCAGPAEGDVVPALPPRTRAVLRPPTDPRALSRL